MVLSREYRICMPLTVEEVYHNNNIDLRRSAAIWIDFLIVFYCLFTVSSRSAVYDSTA